MAYERRSLPTSVFPYHVYQFHIKNISGYLFFIYYEYIANFILKYNFLNFRVDRQFNLTLLATVFAFRGSDSSCRGSDRLCGDSDRLCGSCGHLFGVF